MRIDTSCIERIEKALAKVSSVRAAGVQFVSERANVEKEGAHDAIEIAAAIERIADAHTTQPSNSIGVARSGRRGALRSEVKEEAMAAPAIAGGHERSRAPRRPDPALQSAHFQSTVLISNLARA